MRDEAHQVFLTCCMSQTWSNRPRTLRDWRTSARRRSATPWCPQASPTWGWKGTPGLQAMIEHYRPGNDNYNLILIGFLLILAEQFFTILIWTCLYLLHRKLKSNHCKYSVCFRIHNFQVKNVLNCKIFWRKAMARVADLYVRRPEWLPAPAGRSAQRKGRLPWSRPPGINWNKSTRW